MMIPCLIQADSIVADTLAKATAAVDTLSTAATAVPAEAEVGGWPQILSITFIGFGLVFVLLLLLIAIMDGFGAAFHKKPKQTVAAEGTKKAEPNMVSNEEVAAIAVALKLYKGALHDQESEVLTILNIKRVYSPWNSKILSLTKLPERK